MASATKRATRRGLARVATTWSLRRRVLVGVLVVGALGLSLAGFFVYNEIRPYLLTQVDQQLASSYGPMQRAINGNLFAPGVPVGTFGVLLDDHGHVVSEICVEPSSPTGNPCPHDGPVIPSDLLARLNASSNDEVVMSTSAATSAVPGYRLLAEPVFGVSAFIVAIPLTSFHNTLTHLVWIEFAVSAGVLVLLGALGYGVVRLSMRPLIEIEQTAGQIAAGELSRRVEHVDERTEIGRLGVSLNSMLTQIEHAFTEQKGSEDRLRQFLADASHELRTPVTSIRGYAELFRRGASDRPEDLALAMRRIEDESVRMGVLVDDLLLLARLDQGRPLETNAVDLGVIATDAVADSVMLEPDRPITLDVDEGVVVLGDEQRLRQVVANLMTNARQYTPGEAAITVSVHAVQDLAVVTVADTGPGIAPEHAAHVFERFYRADPSRTRSSGGSGLGLSIVASIADAHGGRAHVESALGRGSRFVIEIPLAPRADGPNVTLRHPAGALIAEGGAVPDESATPEQTMPLHEDVSS